jgi:hypothetical protein
VLDLLVLKSGGFVGHSVEHARTSDLSAEPGRAAA